MEVNPEERSIDAALDWHSAIVESVLEHRLAILGAFHRRDLVAGSRFFAMTYDEIDAFFVAEREQVDNHAIVDIVAAAEAAIRDDYRDRIVHDYKDQLSKRFSAFHASLNAKQKLRPPFDQQGILDEIKASGVMANHIVGQFRNALRLRHWLAHGRYWVTTIPKSTYGPQDVYLAAYGLLAALPA